MLLYADEDSVSAGGRTLQFAFNRKTHACSNMRDGGLYALLLLVIGIVLPLLVTIVSYAVVYAALDRRQRRRRQLTSATPACGTAESPGNRGPCSAGKSKLSALLVCFKRTTVVTSADDDQRESPGEKRCRFSIGVDHDDTCTERLLASASAAMTSSTGFGGALPVERRLSFHPHPPPPSPSSLEEQVDACSMAADKARRSVSTDRGQHGRLTVVVAKRSSSSTTAAGAAAGSGCGLSRRMQDRMLTRVMVTVLVGYVLCFGLYFLVNCVDPTGRNLSAWLHKAGAWFVYLHCCVNPVLYGLTNRQFGADFMWMMRRCRANMLGAAR